MSKIRQSPTKINIPSFTKIFFGLILLALMIFLQPRSIFSQEIKIPPSPTPSPSQTIDSDDLIRVNTNLIQSGVAVFDRNGDFVQNLTRSDFELKIEGKTVPIDYFETIGSRNPLLPVDQQEKNVENSTDVPNNQSTYVLFVIDDVHMAFDNFKRAKDLIVKFIGTEKKPEDFVAIVSSTGKIGFLQQFTNNEIVLKEALARLIANKDYSGGDKQSPPMTDSEALAIDRGVKDVIDVFVELVLRDYPPNLRNDQKTIENVREQIRARAQNILYFNRTVSNNTYSIFEQALRQSGKIEGRKTVFFLSDGFLLDLENSDSTSRINRITDLALRVNAVIYSVDTKGLDASLPDGTAASFRLAAAERFESQDALSTFAKKTGGVFFSQYKFTFQRNGQSN